MKLNQKKLLRQQDLLSSWVDTGCKGIIEAITGFGKTMIPILAIKDMNKRHSDRKTYVVVPYLHLKDEWERKNGHIEEHGLKNVEVFVVNSYVMADKRECSFLVLDEVHHYASKDAEQFSKVLGITKFSFCMGLSATLTNEERDFLYKKGKLGVVGVVDEQEGLREGFVAPSLSYALGIEMDEDMLKENERLDSKFHYYFEKFFHNFNLVQACLSSSDKQITVKNYYGDVMGTLTGEDWRKRMSKHYHWDPSKGDDHHYSPKAFHKYAVLCMQYMRRRKQLLQTQQSKFEYVKDLVEKFPVKTLIFTQHKQTAEDLANYLGPRFRPYHSSLSSIAVRGKTIKPAPKTHAEKKKLKEKGWKIYTSTSKKHNHRAYLENQMKKPDSHIQGLCAVTALDEGFDSNQIEMIIEFAYNSKKRSKVQRKGRGIRKDYSNPDKLTLVVTLYFKNTQEEKWMKRRDGEDNVMYVDSIDEIDKQIVTL